MFLTRGKYGKLVTQKNINRTLILHGILNFQPTSQVELSKILNISKSTVSRVTKELMDLGILKTIGISKSYKNGRHPILLSLNPEYRKSIVIKIGVNYSIVAISNFAMSFEKVEIFKTPKASKRFVEKIIDFIKNNILTKDNVTSISLSIPGIVDRDAQKIIIAPNLGWENLSLSKIIKEKIEKIFSNSINVYMDNEANLAVIAEAIFGKVIREEDRNIVFILFGEGIGTGLIINGKLYRGKHNTAGEFGHMVIEIDGKECHCGNRGCWERYASIKQIKENRFILSNFEFEDPFTIPQDIRKHYAKIVAIGIVNIMNGLDPDVVIVGGMISKIWNAISETVVENVKNMWIGPNPEKERIELTSFPDYPAELYGATLLSFWDVFEGPVLL